MVKNKRIKRLSYEASYRNFVLLHTCIFILHICGIGAYCFIVIFPTVRVLSKLVSYHGTQMILAFLIPSGFIIFAAIACINAKQYGQEIVRLLFGDFLVKDGRIMEKSQNVYTVGPIISKKKRAKFDCVAYSKFYIKDKNCENLFSIGDDIRIIYPCSPKLSVRTSHQLYAIYAFSADEKFLLNTREISANNRKKGALVYLLGVALVSVFLLLTISVLIRVLLMQTFFK